MSTEEITLSPEQNKLAVEPAPLVPDPPTGIFEMPEAGCDLLLRALAFIAAGEGRDLVIPVEALQQAISSESGLHVVVGLVPGHVVVKHVFGNSDQRMADALRTMLNPSVLLGARRDIQ